MEKILRTVVDLSASILEIGAWLRRERLKEEEEKKEEAEKEEDEDCFIWHPKIVEDHWFPVWE